MKDPHVALNGKKNPYLSNLKPESEQEYIIIPHPFQAILQLWFKKIR